MEKTLVFWAFPYAAVGVFTQGDCLFWKCAAPATPSGVPAERSLPLLVTEALENLGPPQGCCTLASPGPFTALRVGGALLEGLRLGWPSAVCTRIPLEKVVVHGDTPQKETVWVVPCGAGTFVGVLWAPPAAPEALTCCHITLEEKKQRGILHLLDEKTTHEALRQLSGLMARALHWEAAALGGVSSEIVFLRKDGHPG